jgi:hypothetical protein
MEDKNKPNSGSLFKSKFKTNDGSEEDRTREDYYGTFKDLNGKVWKLKGYINTSEYGKWLKITLRDPEQQQGATPQDNVVPSFIPSEHIAQENISQDPEDDIPF